MPASGTTATRTKARVPAAAVDHAARDAKVEAYLIKRGFSWEFRPAVPIKKIDQEASLHNQARVGAPLVEAQVERYVIAMEGGDVFPAVVAAQRDPKQGLLLVDGNHRLEAHIRVQDADVPTYLIIGASQQAITLATFELNLHHGLPTSEADRVHQALWLMDNNVSAEDAAAQLQLKVHQVRSAASLAKVDRLADEVGINRKQWDKLNEGVRRRLGQVTTNEGFRALAEFVMAAKISPTDLSKMVVEMNALRSSAKMVTYVNTQRLVYGNDVQTGGMRDTPGMGRGSRTPRQFFGLAYGAVSSLPPSDQIAERVLPNEKPDFIGKVEEMISTLERVRDALKE